MSLPDIRIIAIADFPGGVERAKIVGFFFHSLFCK